MGKKASFAALKPEEVSEDPSGILARYSYYDGLRKEHERAALGSNWISSETLTPSLSGVTAVTADLIESRAVSLALAHHRQKTAMSFQRGCNPRPAMQRCGLHLISTKRECALTGSVQMEQQPVSLEVTSQRASFKGVMRCGNAYCVHCAAQYRQERGERIHRGLQHCIDEKLPAYFFTMTMPRCKDAKVQIKSLQRAWKLLQDKLSYALTKAGLHMRFVRSLDTTFALGRGRKTYHNHLHIIIVLSGAYGESWSDFQSLLLEKFMHVSMRTGMGSVKAAQDVMPISSSEGISRYVTKWEGLAKEMLFKEGKVARKSPYGDRKAMGWMELIGAAERGDKQARAVYRDFIEASVGSKTVSFSQNWDHEVLMADEAESLEDAVLWSAEVHPSTWYSMYGIREEVLTAAYYLVNTVKKIERAEKGLAVLRALLTLKRPSLADCDELSIWEDSALGERCDESLSFEECFSDIRKALDLWLQAYYPHCCIRARLADKAARLR